MRELSDIFENYREQIFSNWIMLFSYNVKLNIENETELKALIKIFEKILDNLIKFLVMHDIKLY